MTRGSQGRQQRQRRQRQRIAILISVIIVASLLLTFVLDLTPNGVVNPANTPTSLFQFPTIQPLLLPTDTPTPGPNSPAPGAPPLPPTPS